jgi:hypothetical protein
MRRRFREKYDWELSQLQDAQLKPGDAGILRADRQLDYNAAKHEPGVERQAEDQYHQPGR